MTNICTNFPYFALYKKSGEQNLPLANIHEPSITRPISYADAVKHSKQKNEHADIKHSLTCQSEEAHIHFTPQMQTSEMNNIDQMVTNLCKCN